MEYLIFMILSTINFSNYNHQEKESICPTCNYHGAVSFANYDSASNNYYFTSVQLGELGYSLDIIKCQIKKDKRNSNFLRAYQERICSCITSTIVICRKKR